MSVYEELLCKINEISNGYVCSLKEDLKVGFDCIDKFEEEYQNGHGKGDQNVKKALVNTLMSINEVEGENSPKDIRKSNDGEKRLSKKRSKEQVDGMSSPEQEKRTKRNASVKAQNNISKQVNINLTQKLRREDTEKTRRRKEDDKENTQPLIQVKQEKISLPPEPMETDASLDIPVVPIKQEPNKDEITMPPPAVPKPRKLPPKEKSTDSEDEASGKRSTRTRKNTETMPPPPESRKLPPKDKSTDSEDEASGKRSTRTRKNTETMPPPPEPRKLPPKEKSTDSEDEASGKRSTRTRKNTETVPPPPAPLAQERPARASRRGARRSDPSPPPPPPPPPPQSPPPPPPPPQPEPRPKRTRAKKKVSETSTTDTENTQPPAENGIGSPADKPRPKRTRRGKKAAEKEETPKPKEPTPEPEVIPKEERVSNPDSQSPVIPQKTVQKTKDSTTSVTSTDSNQSKKGSKKRGPKPKVQEAVTLDQTQVLSKMNTTVTVSMDKTVVLPNGLYDHTDGNVAIAMNETVVLDKINRGTMVLDKPHAKIMDCTVVLDKVADGATPNITDDLSLLTDDNSEEYSSPTKDNDQAEHKSAVKAKVQQFEEMAARTTRTKTRAMAKQTAETENSTPPDKIISKQVLSAETLAKMNNMIFNGKPQISISATKPTAKLPPVKTMSVSASKLTAINKAREEHLSKDDARKKKEAMLEAKKEQQKRKREEKMAAAAAAREAAEKDRRAALQAQVKDRMEKQAHADQGKLERMKEAERKKQELARKVAETEERRRAEEHTRAARLADEQRKADAARKKQQEDSEAIKKEAAMMAKEIEKRQKEYLEKQKKLRDAEKMHTPLHKGGKLVLPGPTATSAPAPAPAPGACMPPVYMSDGFQHLHSDNDDDDDDKAPRFPTPTWCKYRNRQLVLQHQLLDAMVDRWFLVRVHSVDLRSIFPRVERAALKRTSSAVWRTPPALQLARRVQESPV